MNRVKLLRDKLRGGKDKPLVRILARKLNINFEAAMKSMDEPAKEFVYKEFEEGKVKVKLRAPTGDEFWVVADCAPMEDVDPDDGLPVLRVSDLELLREALAV